MSFSAWIGGFFETDKDRYLAARAIVAESHLPSRDDDKNRWPHGGPTLTVGDRAFYLGSGLDPNGVTWTAGDMNQRARNLLEEYAVNLPGEASPEGGPSAVVGLKNLSTGPLPWLALIVVGAVAVAYVVRAAR